MRRTGLLTGTAALVLVLSLVAGCERGEEQPRERKMFGQQEILIGLIPEQNIFKQRERYAILKRYLSDRLGITVNFTSLSRYGNILDRFTAENMDGAFFGSFTGALAIKKLGVEPLVRPVNIDGTSTYHGYIFARKNSAIRSVKDMQGKRFAFVERATTAGYIFPIAYFRRQGVADLHGYLGETFFAGSHDAAILAVLNREADVGAAKNTIYDQLAKGNPRIEKELIIIAASGTVPQNGLAVRRDLDPELKRALKETLLSMEKDPAGAEALRQFGARGFVETTGADYAYVDTLSAEAGIDLKTYRYVNE